nr:MAG TPA: hypothetical protein [Caudoviricetes sp.]
MEVKELKLNRIGYKGFNVKEDGTLYCRDMTFKVGDMAEVKGPLVICKNGIHFCWNLNDVNDYYNLRDSVICEVEPLGEIVADIDGKKCCTNKLKIKRMLTKEEVLKISNTGNENTGYINSGDCNSGNRNSGDCNSGNWNSGNWNSGDCNSGNRNSGDCNSGNWNSGNWNSGDCNSGNCNSGFFNENENKCYIFDKLSDMTVLQFRNSRFYEALNSVPFILTEWVEYTEEEKKADKAKALIGGYLKKYEYKEACKTWWDKLSDKNKKIIQEIPNFDAEKFYRITGIRI